MSERDDQLTNLFIAVRDKAKPAEFEAGLRGRKRRKLADAPAEQEALAGLDDFKQRYSDVQGCVRWHARSPERALTCDLLPLAQPQAA